uniref:Uncharacterized protein n=1 Tax=Cannabis sativa TaxID=3483 RepID=A0A803PB40_CANSA
MLSDLMSAIKKGNDVVDGKGRQKKDRARKAKASGTPKTSSAQGASHTVDPTTIQSKVKKNAKTRLATGCGRCATILLPISTDIVTQEREPMIPSDDEGSGEGLEDKRARHLSTGGTIDLQESRSVRVESLPVRNQQSQSFNPPSTTQAVNTIHHLEMGPLNSNLLEDIAISVRLTTEKWVIASSTDPVLLANFVRQQAIRMAVLTEHTFREVTTLTAGIREKDMLIVTKTKTIQDSLDIRDVKVYLDTYDGAKDEALEDGKAKTKTKDAKDDKAGENQSVEVVEVTSWEGYNF